MARLALVAALSLACLGAGHDAAAALQPQRIAAVVNDEVVSMQDLDDRLQLVVITSGVPDTEEARSRLAAQALRGLIEESLQLQEAERLSITVEEAELDRALQNIAERNNLSVGALRQYLVDNGVALDTMLRQLRAQIAWVKVVNRQIRPRVNVTVDQLELAMEEAARSQGEPELLLSEIVLPVDGPEQEQAVGDDAMRLVQTVREGADFTSLARQFSVAASAERGGDLGWVQAAAIPPELLTALERLQPGDVSLPIRSAVGYHIFWLRERRLAPALSGRPIDGVEVALTQILFPAEAGASTETLDLLRAQAARLRGSLSACPDMIEMAEELAAPASGNLGWIRLGDLPAELAQAVAALPVGEVSAPLRGPAGIHLLMVCERREPEQLSPEREQLARRLENERIERLARRYLRDLRKQAFVEVRL